MDRRKFLQAGLAAAGALTLSGCDRIRALRGPELPEGKSAAGTVRLAGGDFGFPSPFAYLVGPGYQRMTLIYDNLLLLGQNGEPSPWLATSHASSPDGLVHVFQIRTGVRWHDGRPFTAEDVVFSFDYFAAQKAAGKLSPTLITNASEIAEVKAVGETTVEFHLGKPVVTFLSEVGGGFPIFPKHIWSSIGDASRAENPAVLVGTGPYRLGSYQRGIGAYSFSANENFFGGNPKIRSIEMPPVENELFGLLTGDIDVGTPSFASANQAALDRFREDDSFGMEEGPADNFLTALYFNLSKGGALGDRVFRQAVAKAIDRKDMLNRLMGGKGEPGNPGFLPPAHPYHVNVEQYPFNLGESNRMLDQAGYKRSGAVRYDKEGKPLSFKLLTLPDSEGPVEIVIQSLKLIGVEVKADPVEALQLFTSMPRGDYEMAVLIYGGTAGDPDYMRTLYSSKGERLFHSAQGYADAEFDELAERQLVTLNEAERRPLVAKMQQIVARDIPFLHLFYPTPLVIYRKSVFPTLRFAPNGGGPFTKDVFVKGPGKG